MAAKEPKPKLYEIEAKSGTQLLSLPGAPVIRPGQKIVVELAGPTAEMKRCESIGMIKFAEYKAPESTPKKKKEKEEEEPVEEPPAEDSEVSEEEEEAEPEPEPKPEKPKKGRGKGKGKKVNRWFKCQ